MISFPQRAIRAFLKMRTSYDVLPLSYRLITFDTSLLVKKSLNTLILNGEIDLRSVSPCGSLDHQELTLQACRHRVGASVGFKVVDLCWDAHNLGLHQRHPVLLAELGRVQAD